jgi:hypothetical protein
MLLLLLLRLRLSRNPIMQFQYRTSEASGKYSKKSGITQKNK